MNLGQTVWLAGYTESIISRLPVPVTIIFQIYHLFSFIYDLTLADCFFYLTIKSLS